MTAVNYVDKYCGLICFSFQVLTGFTVASLTEDAYGTLQQDIPKVLECLTSTLLALEDYERELKTGHTELTDDMNEVNDAIFEVVVPLMDDIKMCLGEIIAVFGDRLNVFRLPMPVARRLQLLVDVS
ncbi:15738_t:CDS:2 [Acaulospora colombiana]|uniref:15738_t:CDS:1 n=1 Tax=Acaulospora colombiana TaxID=27376 RepID=A0ACA9PBR2_9GLOM|nr:15738_t:CDS:2 [Acaulospora colombiana]